MTDSTDLREGRVTAIRAQSRAPDRVSVYIEDQFAFGIHRDLLLEFDIAKGIELTVEQQEAVLARDAFFKARAAAFRFLSYRDRAAAEIQRRLERHGYEPQVIEAVLEDLERAGFVDDLKFARMFAEGRFLAGGYGPRRVRADLRRRGVKSGAVESAIHEVFGEEDELFERARGLGRKRWERLVRESDPVKRKKKVHDFLARRGFNYDTIRRVLDELPRE